MQLNAKANIIKKNHLKIIKVVDGDGLIVENIFNNQELEDEITTFRLFKRWAKKQK